MTNQETRKAGREAVRRFPFRRLTGACPPRRVLCSLTSVSVVVLLLIASASVANAGGGGNATPTPAPTPHVDAEVDWKNTAGNTDFNTAASWNQNTVPGTGDVAWFFSVNVANPNLSGSLSIAGLYFSSPTTSGYTLSNTNSAVLTLTGYATGTSGGETSNATAVAIGANNTSGTNTISAPLILAPASGSTSTIFQAGGGTLVINSVISGSGISLSKTGAGTLTLSAVNTYTGGTTVNAGTLFTNAANTPTGTLGNGNVTVNSGGTITVGNDNSLVGFATSGSRTITINAGGIIQNLGGSAQHLNALVMNGGVLSATTPHAADGNWIFDFGVSTPGTGNTSTISGGNAALTQGGGTVFNIGASDTLIVSSVLAHFSALSDTGLIKSGAGTLTLSGVNTYTGATTVNAGKLFINGNQTSATGTTTVNNSGTVLGGTGTIGGAVSMASSGAILEAGTGSTGQTLTIKGSLTQVSGSIIELALGPSLTHSTLALTGAGPTSFYSTQKFTFIDLGATTGTYQNIITGVTSDPGTLTGWTITNSGYTGTFSWDGANIDLNLSAVPEPSTWIAGGLAFLAVGYTQRKRFVRLVARA